MYELVSGQNLTSWTGDTSSAQGVYVSFVQVGAIVTFNQVNLCYNHHSVLVVYWTVTLKMYVLLPLAQVQLNVDAASKYVIRTQPTRTSVSTLECIAHTLAWLEQSPSIVEVGGQE